MSEEKRSERGRLTKIVATLGPACDNDEGIAALVRAGMDVARLNFSHGTPDGHRRLAEGVLRAAEREGRPVAVLQDIQGPKIRLGDLPEHGVRLEDGEEVELRPAADPEEGAEDGGGRGLPICYPHLLDDIASGDAIVLGDGMVRLEVGRVGRQTLTARVLVGGELRSRQGVAFPDSELQVPAVTDKDRRDLAVGREIGVDLVAASFVQSKAEVEEVAGLVGDDVPVIAKIERAIAYRNLGEILEAAAGAMVARGDLGVEIPLEQLPIVQHDILARTNAAGRISITATEMLESMIRSPRPSRAEVTDVASSVLEGTDAVMLSAETAAGRYPERAIRAMDAICRATEASPRHEARSEVAFLEEGDPVPSATARAAVQAAHSLGLHTIVAFTESGGTATLLSKYRPQARILAFTPSEATYRRMALLWGVRPRLFERLDSTDAMFTRVERELLEKGVCEPGETVVMVAGSPPNRRASTNLLKLHRLGRE